MTDEAYYHNRCGRCGITVKESKEGERCGARDGRWYGDHIWTYKDSDSIIQTREYQEREENVQTDQS